MAGTWKRRSRSRSEGAPAVETRRENFEGTPEHSEKKPGSRTSQQTEDTAKDSFFLSRKGGGVGEMGDRHERMIFTASLSSSYVRDVDTAQD